MELEKRYRELTDLLVPFFVMHVISVLDHYTLVYVVMKLVFVQYYKQTQLETMASEKAAAEFQLEKEVKRFHEAQVSTCASFCVLTFFSIIVVVYFAR